MMKKILLISAILLMAFSVSLLADPVKLVVEGGGTAQVYQLGNGNYLGLWGFDNRPSGGGALTVNSFNDFNFTSGTVVAIYNGINPVNAGASQFDPLTYGFVISDGARLYDAIWIEWTGGNLVHSNPNGGTATMGASVTLQGDPFATPEPASVVLLGLGILGLASFSRKRE